MRANASKHKAMSYDRMQEEERRLEGEIEALLRQADAADTAEDARLGAEVRGDELPAELRRREERLAAIRAAKARLEAAARAADDARGRQPGQDRNPKGGPPFQQCYNAQVAVDAEQQLVVATDLTANASDQGGLPVLLDAVKETFDAQPERVLAEETQRRRRRGEGGRPPSGRVWPVDWLEAEPHRTAKELFERLQREHPGVFPTGQLRTLQRRVKDWRRLAARRLIFADPMGPPQGATPRPIPGRLAANGTLPADAATPRPSCSGSPGRFLFDQGVGQHDELAHGGARRVEPADLRFHPAADDGMLTRERHRLACGSPSRAPGRRPGGVPLRFQ